ncbi:MAG: inositol monophosphatase [Mariniblastus sp.]|nr:inositol monophosphatase [Mariniblastus sp.]
MKPPFPTSPELEVAILAAQSAGEIIGCYFRKDFETNTKSHPEGTEGLVTQADIAAEQSIIRIIQEAFPDHAIMAEESAQSPDDSEHLWVVDPLDGTNNFAHGIPHFAVSIAYCYQRQPICGVVYDPIRNDWFVAEQGRGAWHNRKQVQVNSQHSLAETMVAVGFYYDRDEMMRTTLSAISDFFGQGIHGIRRMGAAALDIIHVGTGQYGVYFEYTLSPWDFAAAWIFLLEAGGQITDGKGNELCLKRSSVLATNRLLFSEALPIVLGNHPPV